MQTLIQRFLNQIHDSSFTTLFMDASVKSFLILAFTALVILCLRRASAGTRHLVWFLGLLSLLFLPLLSWIVPAWQKPLWAMKASPTSGNEVALAIEFVAAGNSPPVASSQSHPTISSSERPASPSTSIPAIGAQFSRRWLMLCLSVWLVGIAAVLTRFVFAFARLRTARTGAFAVRDPEWLSLLGGLSHEMGVRRRVLLLQSADRLMPVTWGTLRPVILLPAGAKDWSPERRRVVLLHELGHVRRWDCLTQSVSWLVCAIYWFNPIAWFARRRMCVEREQACDDLVLNRGCRASDYAGHLVEIARSFQPVPRLAGIAMARSSRLENRIAAIVDASCARRATRALLLGCLVLMALVVVVAAQRSDRNAQANQSKPWFDARLRAFFSAKYQQAQRLAGGESKTNLAAEVWPYFQAGMRGDWQTATNLWLSMRGRAYQYEGTKPDGTCDTIVWSTVLETDLAWEQFANWKQKYVLAYGNDIIASIPAGSIYFGGTDPGRGLITAMSHSHSDADPFFTLTQNALADALYLQYLQNMYGERIYIPTQQDSSNCFTEYVADVQRRLAENKLKPGEDAEVIDNKVQVKGQVAVMSINGLITKLIFDRNPNHEFYIEESFPLDWMYPYLSPNGLIMKINRNPLPELTEAIVNQDREYWSNYLRPMLGDWLHPETPLEDAAAFVEKVYLAHDLTSFTGDREWIADTWAHKAFSKLRSSIGGVYAWRASNTKTAGQAERMVKEADFAFRQAWVLCPISPEAVFRYVNLLLSQNRVGDALRVATVCEKLDPENGQVTGLVKSLQEFKKHEGGNKSSSGDLQQLEQKVRANPTDFPAAFDLASKFLDLQQTNRAVEVLDSIVNSPQAEANAILNVAQKYASMMNYPKLETTLDKLVKLSPESPEAWYDFAALKASLGKNSEAIPALRQAIELSARRRQTNATARDIVAEARKDPRFAPLREMPEFKQLVPSQ